MDNNYTSYGVCRCCLEKGYHKNIMKEYYKNDTREVYLDIFMECFNLYLSTNTHISTLICMSCVQRLMDANSFRLQVISSEEQLLDSITNKEPVFVNVEVQSEVKVEQQTNVKLEHNDVLMDEEEIYDDEATNDDIIEGETEILSRFPLTYKLPDRSSLYTTCKGFVTHLDLLEGKLVLPKMIAKLLDTDSESTSEIFLTEKVAHIHNASTLLEYSNATPFKSKNRSGFPCFFCRGIHDSLERLKEHQSKVHKRSDIKKILATYGAECLVVYVDITNLKCTICDTDMPSLNELKSHLTNTHKKDIYLEYTDRVIPFKLSNNSIYECQVCRFNFETFGSIERHMNTHYRNYVCNQCGTGFVTKYRLKVHMKSMHVGGSFPCDICKKVYSTQQKHKNHVDTVHNMIKRFKCTVCPERFSEYFRRQKHLVSIHGLAPLHYRCNVCDKTFDRRYTLSRHMKRDHLEERDYQCQLCAYKCFTNSELSVHMIKHNGERIHECTVCNKSYARKKTLREHMRIHNNDRRFACGVCGQSFVQKCSLKGHVKTHHMDYMEQ